MVRLNTSILSKKNISNAIERALTYLHKTQRPSGEFATYASRQLDMQDSIAYPKSVYVTTFVIHSLCYLPEHPLIKPIQQQAAEFLLAEKEDFGGWNYDGRDNWRVPPDLDDTSCAVAALLKLDHQLDFYFYIQLWQSEAEPTGPYYTWIGINDRPNEPMAKQIDGLVNANVLFCAGLLNLSLPNTTSYLQKIVHTEMYNEHNLYCISPHFFIYTLTRAYADGQVSDLESIKVILQDYIINKLINTDSSYSALNLALTTSSLLNLQVDLGIIKPYLKALLNKQQENGSWPSWALYVGYGPDYHGSPALTTSIALEVLGKWNKRVS